MANKDELIEELMEEAHAEGKDPQLYFQALQSVVYHFLFPFSFEGHPRKAGGSVRS